MSLGQDIVDAINALSEADKLISLKIWEAIGETLEVKVLEWRSTTTYAINDFSFYSGKIYKSLQNSNLNKQPDTETSWWGEYGVSDDIPVGVIWMFDGTGWVDNSTMPGWYACIPGNSGQGCPDMVDRFVMGKVIEGAGSTGGANSLSLAIANLPSHNHGGAVGSGGPSPASTGTVSSWHTHVTDIGSHGHTTQYSYQGPDYGAGGEGSNGDYYALRNQVNSATIGNKTSGNPNLNHSHSMQSHTHSTTIPAQGSGTAFNNRPAYYSMIFIRKCA